MKTTIYYFAVILLVAVSCSSSRPTALERDQARALKREQIRESLEAGKYMLAINRILPTHGPNMDLVPDRNYIIIDGNVARVNLAYIGRSYDIRGISGITMTGKIVEKSVRYNNRGNYEVTMVVKNNNESFTFNISVGTGGNCQVNVTNPRIDFARYQGSIRFPSASSQNI